MNEKEFYDSKTRMIGLSVITIALSIIFGGIAISMIIGVLQMDWLVFFVFLIVTIILVPVSLVLLKRSKTNEPSVVISEEGIVINGFIPKIGFIPWKDIDGCVPYKLNKQPMLGFILYDEDKYLNKFTGMNRKILEANRGMGFPAINVPINNLKDKDGFFEALAEQNVAFYLEEE